VTRPNPPAKARATREGIRDGNLITGQQQFSGAAAAELVVQTLGR